MNKVTLESLKIQMREAGVKFKPAYEMETERIVSSALKTEHKKWVRKRSRETGHTYSTIINDLVSKFKPITKNTEMKLGKSESVLLAGLVGQKVAKVFGTRKCIKFTSFLISKPNVYKLDQLSEYYGVSRSGLIRQLIELEMNK